MTGAVGTKVESAELIYYGIMPMPILAVKVCRGRSAGIPEEEGFPRIVVPEPNTSGKPESMDIPMWGRVEQPCIEVQSGVCAQRALDGR